MDYDKIKEEVKEVIRFSQGFSTEPKVDKLIHRWAEAKQSFIEIMGGNLIYELPDEVTFEMNEHDKIHSVEEFIREVEWKYRYNKNIDFLLDFLSNIKQDFFKNEVSKDFSYRNIKIPKGMKINRALKFFFPDNKEELTDIQNEVSRILQKDKVKGILCISVHPLDFLSSSENTYNWRSCHSLDGEFRSGNLSYMVDSSTVICYLRSKNSEQCLPNFPSKIPWNSKKWRMLLHFSEDREMMFAGRQYPFTSEQGMDVVKDVLLSNAGFPDSWTKWDNTKITSFTYNNGEKVELNSEYLEIGYKLKDIKELVTVGPGSLNFNDVLSSSFYDPYYSFRLHNRKTIWDLHDYYSKQASYSQTKFVIGGSVNCLCCGKHEITLPETVRCIDCEEEYGFEEIEDFVYCEDCNRRVYYENTVFVYSDYYEGFRVCPECAEEYNRCEECGAYITPEYTIVDKNGMVYCRHCYGEE